MARLVIEGRYPLTGEVSVEGSKNSALPIITAAALAAEGTSVLENVPRYTDIMDLCQILRELGAEVEWIGESRLKITARSLSNYHAPYELAKKLRGSTYVVGLLLARLKQADVAFPGGCQIGSRPVNFHVQGFQALGATMWLEHGSIHGKVENRLVGTRIYIERASFGTTINLMIAASLAEGTTTLENAAMEPEIVDLANFLNAMGAKVRGAGTNLIRIEGVDVLHGAHHEIIPDRLEAGTYLIAAGVTGGVVTVTNVIPEHLRTVLLKLEQAGAEIEEDMDWIRIVVNRRLQSVDIETLPHPGFPTDLHPQMVSLLSLANGVAVVQETVFENRFGYAHDLVRLGADIKLERETAIVRGVEQLTGAPVQAQDIRGGAALVLAGLGALGTTIVEGVEYIDRGYHALEHKLRLLGAKIYREDENSRKYPKML
ncbi:UDP-N-acetylglucosamine 1-carboxyvinyltransferase [Sulfobacillus thermosulfidooxidans]|uniref:UDP-N-acetylglucosamine 1-carboxyvinyltransferase n=1 Tax=Sulfobacillus thermosulfidooxidans TaxID=28034 RepID=UPI00096BAAB2|nr:UDP-N-acetylglucosamine 1-carboxyvinyltransferase [Sulfobacillus thermosulfidooxidans]OLZ09988.1 UDP-N-acetylglucosamine 1-carboxyvinyltransferase [Sulfobacillus thermosulfidooxidans]OLZ15707.1 UDP-N-acetylglucosamine 1-carboxyvinyltransferase [Sulfobacillus thermosulfidooxidans]OLZ18446.1 UDP-N-acetylglucosamine 1-carboxyvinyltransferase [Sulfobacillus thermosulfidooxidans]